MYPNVPNNNKATTSGGETATKASCFFIFRDVNLSAGKWREMDEKGKRVWITRSPTGICHSSATQPMQIQFDFNSLILDCIIWDVIKISHCFSREQQSVSQKPRRRYAKRLSVLLAPTSRYRADYALLAVHGDLIVRSKLTVFHRCEAEQISLGWEISVQ